MDQSLDHLFCRLVDETGLLHNQSKEDEICLRLVKLWKVRCLIAKGTNKNR